MPNTGVATEKSGSPDIHLAKVENYPLHMYVSLCTKGPRFAR